MDTKAWIIVICCLAIAKWGFTQNVGLGTTDPKTSLDLNGDLALRSTSLELTNGILNAVDVSPKFSNFRITGPTAAFTIAGLSVGLDGKLVTLFNRSGQTMTVTNEAGSATAENRIITGTDANINIPNNASVQFQYDNTIFRWVLRAHSAPTGGVAISGGWGLLGNAGLNNTNFIGTTDAAPLTLKQNNSIVGYFTGTNLSLGVNAGAGLTAGTNNAFILGKMRSPLITAQNSVAIGPDAEISGDNQIIIGAPYHKTGIGLGYNESPDHTLTVGRRYGNAGALAIIGGTYNSHFNYGNAENTYIRGGKLLSTVYVNDQNGGDVILGSVTTSNVGIGTNYVPTRRLEIYKGRIYLNGAPDVANNIYPGIEFSNAAATTVKAFVGMASDDLIGFYGYPWSGFGMLMNVNTGNVTIGTNVAATGFKLSVAGKIMSEEIRVQSKVAWPDYVFKAGYHLPTLAELEQQITLKGHLPNIPNAATVAKEGIAVGEMQTLMMQKIEELTLYIIQLDKNNALLKQEINQIRVKTRKK